MQESTGVRLLASMPLDCQVRLQADQGTPIVRSAPDSEFARRYRSLARELMAALSAGDEAMSRMDAPGGLRIEISPDT